MKREPRVMEKIKYFDYRKVAKEMSVPDAILRKIEKEVKDEFPEDKILYELYVLKALRSKDWEGFSN
jgi:hypothetical protein